jgi:glycosyltransferase involved in cell wall biosynthesis
MSESLVSIGLPVFNGSQYIRRALESLLKQDYFTTEIIISDDNSSDDTYTICENYANRYSNIRLTNNTSNIGGIKNFQKTLRFSKGEYFVWASQDDYWESDFVSTLVKCIKGEEGVVLAMGITSSEYPNETICEIQTLDNMNPNQMTMFQTACSIIMPFDHDVVVKNNHLIHGLIKINALRKVDRAFPGVMLNERYYLFLLALLGKIRYKEKILFHKTIHKDYSRKYDKNKKTVEVHLQLQGFWLSPIIGSIQMLIGTARLKITHNRKIAALGIVLFFPFSLAKRKFFRFIKSLINNNKD